MTVLTPNDQGTIRRLTRRGPGSTCVNPKPNKDPTMPLEVILILVIVLALKPRLICQFEPVGAGGRGGPAPRLLPRHAALSRARTPLARRSARVGQSSMGR